MEAANLVRHQVWSAVVFSPTLASPVFTWVVRPLTKAEPMDW